MTHLLIKNFSFKFLRLALIAATFFVSHAFSQDISSKNGEGELVKNISSIGTGFFVSNNGYIVTAYHVVKGGNNIYVRFGPHNSWRKCELIKYDPKLDLALLKINANSYPIKISKWENVPVGLEAYVIGFPLIDNRSLRMRISEGIINGTLEGIPERGNLFQLSAQVQKGNSGGPVLSPDGNLVGVVISKINVMKVLEKTNDFPQNINFALNSSALLDFLSTTDLNLSPVPVNFDRRLRPYEVLRMYDESVVPVLTLRAIPQ